MGLLGAPVGSRAQRQLLGSCSAPARRGGLPECRQQKRKCREVNGVHARGTSCCCLGPSIHLSEGYHFGDAINKGARTVSGCQSLRETCLQPPLGAGAFRALTAFCASKMKENRTRCVLSASCQSQRDTLTALKKELLGGRGKVARDGALLIPSERLWPWWHRGCAPWPRCSRRC